jgi:branched-chain amino acid transport system substrate-binding protein
MRKELVVAVLFIIGLATFTGMTEAVAKEKGVTDNEIVIGSISPLTGNIAMVGVAIANGAKDYFNYINEKGGINGRTIKFIAEDDKYEPPTAIASLKKLITRDKIFACSSTSGTPITAALTPSIEREKLPSFCTIAASSIFYPKPPAHIFSFGPYYSENMIFNIEYMLFILKAQKPRIALFYQDDEFGMEGKKGFEIAVEKYNLNVVGVEKYSRGAIDISSQVYNLKAANPDYVFATTIPSHSIMLLKEAKKMGLDVPILAVANTRFEEVIKVAGDAAANFYVTEYTALPNEKGVPAMEKMMDLWYRNNPANTLPARYYILSHVNAIIMVEAMKRCGKDLTREKFINALESMRDFGTGGISGDITYSASDHCPLSAMRLVKANPASLSYEPVTDWELPKISIR